MVGSWLGESIGSSNGWLFGSGTPAGCDHSFASPTAVVVTAIREAHDKAVHLRAVRANAPSSGNLSGPDLVAAPIGEGPAVSWSPMLRGLATFRGFGVTGNMAIGNKTSIRCEGLPMMTDGTISLNKWLACCLCHALLPAYRRKNQQGNNTMKKGPAR
jgi:hypothetical protein